MLIKVQSVEVNNQQRVVLMARSCSEQEKSTVASLRVVWTPGKKKKEKYMNIDSKFLAAMAKFGSASERIMVSFF